MVPVLRFPEFRDEGGWQPLHGDEVFDQISNKDHNSDLPILAITQEHGAIPREEIDYHVSVTDKSIESYKVVEAGDFIISLRSFQGGIEYSNYKGLCSPAYVILRKKIDVNNQFYKQFFKTNIFIQSMNKNIEGIRDGKMVSYQQFSELLLPNPSTDEQQKIVDCLSFLDELITAQTEKLDSLRDHKKGLVQQLFPSEGKTIPNMRFPEFQGEGAWEEVQLGNFITQHNEKTVRNKQYPVLTSSRRGILFQSDYYNDRDIASEDTTGYNVVPRGFFTYRHMSDDLIFKFNINDICDRGIVSTLYPVFAANDCVDPFFLKEILNEGYEFKKFALAQKQGGSRTYMYLSKLKNLFLHMPRLKEQIKIAECLSSSDELIIAQSQKLDALKAHKKGLMQQLFPAMDEVSA